MKSRSKKIGTIAAVFAASLGVVATAISVPMSLNKHTQEKKANPDLFLIENGEIKGFKPEVTKEQIKEYTSDGVLRLPAAKVISADAFNATLKDAPFGETISIDPTTEEISPRAFYGNTASNITFSGEGISASKLKTIGKSAFAFCKNLTAFAFPAGMFASGSTVAKGAFFGCSALTTLDCSQYTGASEFVYSGWSRGAFRAISQTGKLVFAGNETTPPETSVKTNYANVWTRLAVLGLNPAWTENWNDDNKTEWSKQIKVAPTEYLTFSNSGATWTGINSTLWPTSVTAFNAVNLPSTVNAISLSGLTWTERSSVATWNLANTGITTVPANFMSGATLGSSVEVLLPSSVTTIGADAFNGCTAKITLAANTALTSIGDNGFKGNTTITSVKFGSTLSIGAYAFNGCTGLTTLDFSNLSSTTGVTIGSGAFTDTGSSTTPSSHTVTLTTLSSKIDQWQLETSFKTLLNNAGMTIGTGSSDTWQWASPVSLNLSDLLDIQDGVLNGWAKNSSSTELTKDEISTIFSQYSLGTTLTIPSSVRSIAANAFYSNSATKIPSVITKVAFDGTNCTSIGANAFTGATSLTEVVIPNTIATIGNSAFANCNALATIDLSAWTAVPTWTGTGIFSGIASAGTVKVQDIDNQIDQWRFNGQIKTLLGLTFGSSNWVFDNADSAELVNVNDSGVATGFSEGTTAYAETAALTDTEKYNLANEKYNEAAVVIPNNATSIAANAFINDSKVSTIPSTLPTVKFATSSTCASIGNQAFYAAPITSVDFTNATALTSIGEHSFSGSSLTSVSIPSTVTTISEGAFYGCNSLTTITFNKFDNTLTLGLGAFGMNDSLNSIILSGCTVVPSWTIADNAYVFADCNASGTITVGTLSGTTTEAIKEYFNGPKLSDNDMANWTVTEQA